VPETLQPNDRLESWKEIASFFGKGVSTVQRWEKEEGLPVHRHRHAKFGSVYAYRSELGAWRAGRELPAPPALPVQSTLSWKAGAAGVLLVALTAAAVTFLSGGVAGRAPKMVEAIPVAADFSREARPSLSPDGSWLAYDIWATGIWVKPIEGQRRQLTNEKDCCPEWSPDGKRIAFSRANARGSRDLVLMTPERRY
jgi:hypothetical protein